MWILRTLYSTLVDALFPLSPLEREILAYTPEYAYSVLPPAPTIPFPHVYSVFAYKDERVARLIWNIKYKKSAVAVSIGGYSLHQKLLDMKLLTGTIIIPIPITPQRRRERGFNQCELLIDEIQRLDETKHFEFNKNLLIRTQHANRQTLKERNERLESVKGIFSINDKVDELLQGRTLVVIDDVITTGSTIKEAMETLVKLGFRDVRGLSLAH